MSKIYIGIDVGAKGAMCWTFDWKSFNFFDYDKNNWRYFLESNQEDINMVMIEKVHSFKGQGVKSMFTFGEKFGWIQGVLESFRIPYRMIEPRRWQKLLKVEAGSGKQGIYKRVKELYPQCEKKLVGSRGGLKDGRCDSLGILNSYKYIKE